MTYSEQLRDPRWQKKRLEILSRDKWACTLCGDTETTLHVHHKKYTGNAWDADNGLLITYCEPCHGLIEVLGDKATKIKSVLKLDRFKILYLFAKTFESRLCVASFDNNKIELIMVIHSSDLEKVYDFIKTND